MKPMAWTMVVGGLLGSLAAQDRAPTAPKRSLAEGLVRQLIEREQLRPPYLESGLEMGAGEGSLVLMVRRADGTLELHEIQRGRGDHGPAPEKQGMAEPVIEEGLVEEGKEGPRPAADPAVGPEAQPAQRKRPIRAVLALQLKWHESQVILGTADQPTLVTGKTVDRAQLQPVMERLFALTRDSEFEGQIVFETEPGVPMQDLFAAQEVARAAGFTLVMYGNRGAIKPASAADCELIAGLAARFEWPVGRLHPGSPQPVCEGELLLLLDGPTTWGDIGPLYMQFARVGIWRIGFVGQKDIKTRFKLPANLPFDRGR